MLKIYLKINLSNSLLLVVQMNEIIFIIIDHTKGNILNEKS